MSALSPVVVPIFATPLGVVQLPEASGLNPAVAALLSARAAVDVNASHQQLPCYRSGDDLLDWTEAPIGKISSEMLRGVLSVVAAVNEFSDAQLQSLTMQARGWFTIVRPNGYVPASSYPLTSWCGIYCVEAPQPSADRKDSGVLRLYESRLGTMFADATNSTTRVPYTPGHYTWQPVPGQIAVFPASIKHEVALVRSSGQLILVTVRVRFVGPGQEGQSRW
jgi:Putative 2OG-Fe(II) oxygenase